MASYMRVKVPGDATKLLKLIKNGLVAGSSVEFYVEKEGGEIKAVVWLDKRIRWSDHTDAT
jgi:hypothetical protein